MWILASGRLQTHHPTSSISSQQPTNSLPKQSTRGIHDDRFNRRLASAALLASAFALASAPLTQALPPQPHPTAGEWDIAAYDGCVSEWADTFPNDGSAHEEDFWAGMQACCANSGGVWSGPTSQYGKCGAPASRPRQIPDRLPTTNIPTTNAF
jgi:hypothetical protein